MRLWFPLAAAVFALLLSPPPQAAAADGDGMCRTVQVDMVPTSDLQIVVWLEDAAGNYVDTVYITRLTGTYGLGNRPGMMTFNTAWRWPYGRRISTFPVWAHRHGIDFPMVGFQNGQETNLSHPLSQSSTESFYCAPLLEGEPEWDAQSCASVAYTDKGIAGVEVDLDGDSVPDTDISRYPPRADLTRTINTDHSSVSDFAELNVFDAVSRATPPGGEDFRITWAMPEGIPNGDYVLWVEVSKELDQNASYDYPEPVGIPWVEYGIAYRGQPSVVWSVPFTLADEGATAWATEYAGYGDPDGLTGMLFAPDSTITSGTPGSGSSRLLLTDDGSEMYRVRVAAQASFDDVNPAPVGELEIVDMTPTQMQVTFTAPGDDGMEGLVSRYDIRMHVGAPLTEDNWDAGMPIGATVSPAEPGSLQSFVVPELLPRTNYYIGVRALDECGNAGEITVIHALTPDREAGRVDACFVATAAYGSLLEGDVTLLRQVRDKYLRKTVTGEIFVESYYTFGPALAQLIAPSDTARRAARAGLGPLVDAVRQMAAERAAD